MYHPLLESGGSKQHNLLFHRFQSTIGMVSGDLSGLSAVLMKKSFKYAFLHHLVVSPDILTNDVPLRPTTWGGRLLFGVTMC